MPPESMDPQAVEIVSQVLAKDGGVSTWAPEFGGGNGFSPPEKHELVLSIEMGCADTAPKIKHPVLARPISNLRTHFLPPISGAQVSTLIRSITELLPRGPLANRLLYCVAVRPNASCSLRRALLMPQVHPGSTLSLRQEQPVGHAKRKGACDPPGTLNPKRHTPTHDPSTNKATA